MKYICLLFLVIVAVSAEDKYTPSNDNLDIEAVVRKLETLKAFTACFLDKGDCDEVTGDFKKDLPEAVATACAKCTDAQKHITKRYLEGLEERLPEDFQAFKAKYDPDNKHLGPLKAAIANS